jgi:hypothetical protein
MKNSRPIIFRNAVAGNRMAAAYRKQIGLGLDGQPRRYSQRKKQKEDKAEFEKAKQAHQTHMNSLHVPKKARKKGFPCGMCGKPVIPYKFSKKCDGWHWHKKCWRDFLIT